ncbi:UDP-glucose 4-epimerase [Verrucomicrobium sp. GAS474]|uniref:NAD-dependent epimerase/dehydratase family protein n=1 Tax=Verrucomicrobium sp. GAS474 TaxID=1882831 RepID=UPI00087D6C79|nr:NAD-dependent epimerase/dehydratase family protein [Verrucomicrobium sp. GAS474]SDU12639.1 UDP-glucose 4-epimerase [Verrucomicrobium sp. GAS474]
MSDAKVKVLVTGAAGFIGSHICRHLIREGCQVVALDDLSGGFADHVPPEAEFVRGSINDEALINDLFATHRFEEVYHLAAYAAEGLSHFIKHFNYTNNLLGSVNLINASVNHGVKLFVFTSSIAVYGRNQLPMREELVPAPEDPYGIAKYAVELDLAESHEMFGLNYAVFRPHNVYGEHQNLGDPYRNVIGIFMNRILRGEPLTIFGDGTQTRAFSYIDDVAPAIVSVRHRPEAWNQVFNVGADTPYEVRRLADVIAADFGVKTPEIQFLPARNEVEHAYCSHEKIRRFFPETARAATLEEGVAKMGAWARKVGSREGQPFGKIEVPKNMPPSWAALTLNQARK